MNQFIIATHATLAEGFADVIRFFKADLENVQYINAYVESQEFEKEFRAALERVKGENIIVLTDILGGSVNQVAARLMGEFQYQLVTGINLALLLELVFIPDDISEETLEQAVLRSREQMVYMNSFTLEEDEEEL
jgi:mannose/fructose-specific phosphotransferase system component IIA